DDGGRLHPGQRRLEERETGMHAHDEDRRDDDPEGVGGDRQLVVSHPRRSPVRWWTTFAAGEVQQRPSPEEWPLRAASAIAETTRSASASSTRNVSRVFGRKRDSNVRPRYSCVTPRSRP